MSLSKSSKYKLAIFDMDGTMVYETILPDVFCVIEAFRQKNINMAVASYNPHAKFLCDRYDISKYFDIICGYYKDSKINHIKEIKEYYKKSGIEYKDDEIIFFDDDIENIKTVSARTKIRCVLVNTEQGITKDMIKLVQDSAVPAIHTISGTTGYDYMRKVLTKL